jgi:hypothetical protein
VTTIPASAYWGVAIATGDTGAAVGALVVLLVNVCLLVISGTVTLLTQRWLAERQALSPPSKKRALPRGH